VRAFVKSDASMVQAVAPRIFGSPDLYGLSEQEADQSINFVTCHDGFTLNDLVSYNDKHNLANGEENRDGNNANRSWNCGAEGPTDDSLIERLRRRQIKNFLAFTLLSLGVPMLLMGDEVRRTQFGNNNAYCQDNEISWLDWTLREQHAGIHLFVRRLIRFRLELYIFKEIHGLSLTELLRLARIEWHGTQLHAPDNGPDSRTLAVEVAGTREAIYCICNAYWEPLDFELPAAPFGCAGWRRILDTSLESPDDFQELATAPLVLGPTYRAEARSCVLLAAEIPYLART
jgi:glycogen operon protein